MKRRLAIVAALALLTLVAPPAPPVLALEEADRLYLVGERATVDRFFPVARRALERFVSAHPSDKRRPQRCSSPARSSTPSVSARRSRCSPRSPRSTPAPSSFRTRNTSSAG